MAVRNAHWYVQNETRAYPLDDAATADDDAGRRLPSDVIADLNLRWPATLGRYAFVTAVSVTPALVTLTIQAADSPTAAGGFTPLAVVSARQPVAPGRMIALAPQAPGVGGWVAFGTGVANVPYAGRFSTPAQSRLTARAARAYRPLPVRSLQAQGAADRLTGVVTLKAAEPLAITKEERTINGALRDCVVVRLVDDAGAEGFPVPAAAAQVSGYKAASVFRQFAGPCAGRPESNTCGCPAPIEYVNAVAPDCTGTITIEFQGCAQVAQIRELCGIAVGCQFGLVDACLPAQLPSSAGLLPSEYTPANIPVPPDVPAVPPEPPVSVSYVPIGAPPYLACFLAGGSDLGTAVGAWTFSEDAGPTPGCGSVTYPGGGVSESLSASASASLSQSYGTAVAGSLQSASTAGRCVAVFDVDVTTAYRKATTELKLLQGPPGAKHAAQLVINYHAGAGAQAVYFAAEVNYDTQEFRLLRFTGTAFQVVAPAAVAAPGVQLDKWYRVEATVLPGVQPGGVSVHIRLTSVTDPGDLDVSLTAETNTYQPASGKFGVGTNRTLANFAYLKIEEVTT